MRYLEWSNSHRQDGEWWLPGGLGEGESWRLMGTVPVREAGKVLGMECGDPYTAVWISFKPLNYILKTVNSVLCI